MKNEVQRAISADEDAIAKLALLATGTLFAYFQRGGAWRDPLAPTSSGTAAAPIDPKNS